MDTSHNHLREPSCEDYPFIGAKRYIDNLSQPEKEDILASMAKDVGKIRVENIPDEEDLTQVRQGCHHVLKFKDKIFNPAECSGMGKVFLRKNMVLITCDTSKNILTLSMFEDKHGLPMVNTIFIIQYDYDLDGGFITLPENSVLLFAGGSLRNGTVMLRNTLVLPVALDIEHYMSVNIRGAYKEGSLVYLRKKLRLFDGTHWITIGAHDLTPIMNAVKKYLNFALDIVAPFKIELSTEKNYVEHGLNNIRVSWSYNRLINNQDIRLESGHDVRIYEELDKNIRSYTFENVELNEPATIVVSTTYKGETVSEAVTLTFDKNPGLVIDDELDENSTNPVTNRAITRVIRQIERTLNNYVTVAEYENYQDYVDETYLKKNDAADIYLTKQDAGNTYLTKEEAANTYLVDADLSGINSALNNKVDKEAGKGLSSNDFTDGHKQKLEGIDLSNYASKNHTHQISDIEGLASALDRAGITYRLEKNNSVLTLIGSDGSTSSVEIDNGQIDRDDLDQIIRSKLRLSHGTDNTISLNYDGTQINSVTDLVGEGGGIDESDVEDLIKDHLDVSHVGKTIKLTYKGQYFGSGTEDMKGDGGGGDDDDDGLPGNILIYFLGTDNRFSVTNPPPTPTNGQINNRTVSDGTWSGEWTVLAPNHQTGKLIWMSQIYLTYSENTYGNWSRPMLIDDGADESSAGSDRTDMEYIYALANIEDAHLAFLDQDPSSLPAQQQDDYVPFRPTWQDNPQGISESMRYEFISVRYKTDGMWSQFTPPVLWSSYGRNGTDGDGVEYIFYKGISSPTQDPSTWYTDNDSKSGSTDSDGVPFNKDEYILRNSGWTDNPLNLNPGETLWVSVRKYRDDIDPVSGESTEAYWHQYSPPTIWNYYAKDAVAVGALDFDNQTMGLPVNDQGTNALFTDVAYAYIYKDMGTVPIQSLTCDGLYQGDSVIWTAQNANSYVTINGNKVTVSIPSGVLPNDGTSLIGQNYTLRFTAIGQGNIERTGTIKLIGLMTGSDGSSYKLNVGTVVLKGVGTQTGLNVPDKLYPTMILVKGTETFNEYSVTQLPSNFKVYYAIDDLTHTQQLNTNDLSTLSAQNQILIQLIYVQGNNSYVIDEELIFVIKDGAEGIPATVYNIVPLSSSVNWDPDTNKTTGTVTFKAYRKIGSNTEEYLSNGTFGTTSDSGSISAKLDETAITVQPDSQELFTISIDENGQYSVIQLNLLVLQTQVCSIIIPIVQKGSSGSQTLLQGTLRLRDVDCSNGSTGVLFYDGRHPDPSASNGYFQDFVRWNGNGNPANGDNWGTYLCVNNVNLPPAAIPSDGVKHGYFVKLDYTFAEVVSYLIADRAWIDELSVRQVVVFDDATPVPNIVAGMTSGSTLPTELTDKNYTNSDVDSIRIWAGPMATSDINSAPFTVSESGHLKATNATINGNGTFSGTINATDGSFTGTVNATSGSFVGDVTAKNFNVVNENNITVLQMSTWGEVSQDVDLSLIDSTTLSNLTSDSLVILLTDPSTNTKYLLNLISLTGSGTVGDPETFYEINNPGQASVTVREKILIKDSLDIYHVNSSTLANGHYYEFVPNEGDLGASGVITRINLYHFVLQGALLYKEVEFNNGIKSYVSPNPIDLIIDKSWLLNGTILSSGSLVSYIGTPEQLTSNVTAFNESTFIAGDGVDVSVAANSIASTPLRVTYTGQPTIYRADVNTSSSLVDFGQMTRLYYNSQLGPGFYSVNRN